VIKIKFVGAAHSSNLVRTDADLGWASTPLGMPTRCGSGPPAQTCLACIHLDLAVSVWSDRGRAAPCLETRRLTGKPAQPVPIRSPACSRHATRPNAEAAIAFADQRLDEAIGVKREQIRKFEAAIKRLNGEIREIQLQRDDDGEDVDWRGFEPDNREEAHEESE
jgi:hypothetical protein